MHPGQEIPLGRQEHRGFPGDEGSVRGSLSSGQPRGLPGMRTQKCCVAGCAGLDSEHQPQNWNHPFQLPSQDLHGLRAVAPSRGFWKPAGDPHRFPNPRPLGLSLGPGCRAVGAVPRFCLLPCPLAKLPPQQGTAKCGHRSALSRPGVVSACHQRSPRERMR